MSNDYGVSDITQGEGMTGGQFLGQAASMALNPINYYLYNPNAFSISKGTMKVSAKIPTAILRGSGKFVDWTIEKFGGTPIIKAGVKNFINGNAEGLALMKGQALDVGLPKAQRRTRDLIKSKIYNDRKNKTSAARQEQLRVRTNGKLFDRHMDKARSLSTRRSVVGELKPLLHPMLPENIYVPPSQRKSTRLISQRKQLNSSLQKTYKSINHETSRLARINSASKLESIGVRQILGNVGLRHGGKVLAGMAKGGAYLALASLTWDIASMVGDPIGRAVMNKIDKGYSALTNIGRPEIGGQLSLAYLNVGAATERQRALAAISKSQLNARSSFGSEASFLHQ